MHVSCRTLVTIKGGNILVKLLTAAHRLGLIAFIIGISAKNKKAEEFWISPKIPPLLTLLY
ncbi:hypothetical protein C7N43_35875 [Sphingobacteriales bacterium UPWRP_1]|nr:hypothetical protein B6N25_01765 [Sphingobacteriales bacterium TSM_CSS]PSJ72109.1 hypothetical protein C7N43_35875 [Sphingobacteriales bacterium UPWRP_1]